MTRARARATGGLVDRTTFDRGLQIRREVLGSEYVDRSIASADVTSATAESATTSTYDRSDALCRSGPTRALT